MSYPNKFFKKLSQLPHGEAIVSIIIALCNDDVIDKYYKNLHDHNYTDDIAEREVRIRTSNSSLCQYYVNMEFDEKSCIYDSFVHDDDRHILTRWRLSNHDLQIEKGRYKGICRDERLCDLCEVLEDEHHAVFVCAKYEVIRQRFRGLLDKNNDIKLFLNPTYTQISDTAKFLREVEALRKV